MDKLYLLLEIEKIKQNHKRIPTTFIYPTGGFSFSCITYEDNTRIIYNVHKNSLEGFWIVTPQNKIFAKEFFYESTCLYDTLFHFNKFIKTTAFIDVDCETGIWKVEKGLEESLFVLNKYKE
ncbi:hypothetical protein PAEPH01_1026 [Pancytospora epiphaga]|nr:hypothetical protein PAEPH01_1026 [Pancytospora epiphaga]